MIVIPSPYCYRLARLLRRVLVLLLIAACAREGGAQQPTAGLKEEAVLKLLRSKLSPLRIAKLVDETCFDGPLDDDQQARLRSAGAPESLLSSLRSKRCERPTPSSARLQVQSPATSPGINEEGLLKLLGSGVRQHRIEKLVTESCFDGPLDPDQIVRLRRKGTTGSLLNALRNFPCARPTAARLRLLPDSLVLMVGASGDVTIEGSGSKAEVQWSVADKSVARVEAGVVRALRSGQTMVYATVARQDLSIPVKVLPLPPVPEPTLLVVQSDRNDETIRINDIFAGYGSVETPVEPGRTVRVSLGTREDRRDTVVKAVPSGKLVLQLLTTDRRLGVMPDRGELFVEFRSRLRPLPAPVKYVPVTPPSVGASATVSGSLLLGAGALIASSSRCTDFATAPAPHGGFIGSTYIRPGEVSATVRTACLGASVGSGLALGGVIAELVRRGVNRGRLHRHARDRARYLATEKERVAAETHNSALIDSVYRLRALRANLGEAVRQWKVTVTPRSP